jgi:catechol 2,3-dioxygenase-like lactoylglutathione lyase family enzyme
MAAPTVPAITHVAVTVTDIEASAAWYTSVLGVSPVLDEDTGPGRQRRSSTGPANRATRNAAGRRWCWHQDRQMGAETTLIRPFPRPTGDLAGPTALRPVQKTGLAQPAARIGPSAGAGSSAGVAAAASAAASALARSSTR